MRRRSGGDRSANGSTQVTLIDVPADAAQSTVRWLQRVDVNREWLAERDDRSIVVAQSRELMSSLRDVAPALTNLVDQVVSAQSTSSPMPQSATNTIVVDDVMPVARLAADILATIERLGTAPGDPMGRIPADVHRVVGWLADECDRQRAGGRARPFVAVPTLPEVPCALLRTATDVKPFTPLHALRHRGLTPRQVDRLHGSDVVAALSARPGVSLEQLVFGLRVDRVDLLGELGMLIEAGAVLGIDHRWYVYDIALVALQDLPVALTGCGCPSTVSTQACHTPPGREPRWRRRALTDPISPRRQA